MKQGDISAIILAAGYSSRMGDFKPLLPLGETTVLEWCINLFRSSGIGDVRVVTGHRADELLPLLERLQVRPLRNERYQEGMFSSVITGVESLDTEQGAFFLLPVDIPLVTPETVELLLQSYRTAGKGILYPACNGRAGHPPLIAVSYRERILAWKGAGGLKALLACYNDDSALVETGDEGILLDMDTPKEYEQLRNILQAAHTPSRQTCERLLSERFNADSPVIPHCRAVAQLARKLAEKLNESGYRLDVALIETAALLHDIAKGERGHAEVGAAFLRTKGYEAVAGLVAVHMDLPARADDDITAADVLYLADKLVEGDRLVSLETRFGRQLERHAGDSSILAGVARRLECACSIKRRIEDRLGMSVANSVSGVQV